MQHMKNHKGEELSTNVQSNQDFHYKADQTCHISLYSKHKHDEMISCKQTYENNLMTLLVDEESFSPEQVRQDVTYAESVICKTDHFSQPSRIAPVSPIKTEVAECDVVVDEF